MPDGHVANHAKTSSVQGVDGDVVVSMGLVANDEGGNKHQAKQAFDDGHPSNFAAEVFILHDGVGDFHDIELGRAHKSGFFPNQRPGSRPPYCAMTYQWTWP